MLELRETKITEITTVLSIIEMAKKLLKSEGIPQWNGPYPLYEDILEDCQKRQSFVLLEDDQIVGTCALVRGPEKNYEVIEGQWLSDRQDYLAIHRIALHPVVQGKGYMQKFLSLINERGNGHFRVDTHELNSRMLHHLKKAGFQECGRVWMEDHTERVAFEKIK